MKFTLIKLYISLFLLHPLNIGFFLSIYWKTPKIYCIEEPETIKEPYQTPDDLAKKRGFILKVLGLYKWKNIPVAKVIFYDCEKYAHQIRDERTGSRVVSSFSSVTWLNKVERILANQQVGCGMRFLTLTCTRFLTRNSLYCIGLRLAQYLSFSFNIYFSPWPFIVHWTRKWVWAKMGMGEISFPRDCWIQQLVKCRIGVRFHMNQTQSDMLKGKFRYFCTLNALFPSQSHFTGDHQHLLLQTTVVV